MKKILVIDDEKDLCYLLKASIETGGEFMVLVATSGKAGIELARSKSPDLILLDIAMPVMDGFTVLKKLKASETTMPIPVFMLTASVAEEDKLRAARLYDEDYIVKPVALDVLKEKIRKTLSI